MSEIKRITKLSKVAYGRLLQIGKVAGALTFLFGIPYGFYQYLENKQDKRVEQSLSLFKQYNSSPFTNYRENVSSTLAKHKKEILIAAKSEKELERVIGEIIEKDNIETDILLLMDFYDGVVVCVLTFLCDPETTEKLFAMRARELFINFYQYIKLQRNTSASTNFGIGLETIAKSQKRAGVSN